MRSQFNDFFSFLCHLFLSTTFVYTSIFVHLWTTWSKFLLHKHLKSWKKMSRAFWKRWWSRCLMHNVWWSTPYWTSSVNWVRVPHFFFVLWNVLLTHWFLSWGSSRLSLYEKSAWDVTHTINFTIIQSFSPSLLDVLYVFLHLFLNM